MIPISIMAGGAIGALSRYYISEFVSKMWPHSIHFGTLSVNILGSLLIGCLIPLLEKSGLQTEWRFLIITGFLGAFTTFSTYSFETFSLFQKGEIGSALMTIALHNGLGLVAVAGGVLLGKQFV